MIEELATMILWGFITIFLLISGEVAIEYAYIGMCMMLVAGLLHKDG